MIYRSDYQTEIDKLTEQAKLKNPKAEGLNLGEKFFVTLLNFYIKQYRTNQLTAEELKTKKKQLEKDLINYWDFGHIFKRHTEIRNRQSQWFVKAEKEGCPICRKLVRIFDGRDTDSSKIDSSGSNLNDNG